VFDVHIRTSSDWGKGWFLSAMYKDNVMFKTSAENINDDTRMIPCWYDVNYSSIDLFCCPALSNLKYVKT